MPEPSWSVALPFPSSPHWAPRITIAGITHPSRWWSSSPGAGGAKCTKPRRATAPGLLRPHVIKACAGTCSVRQVEPLLLITNAEAGGDHADLERALAVLRSGGDVEVCHTGAPGELDGVLHRRGGRR